MLVGAYVGVRDEALLIERCLNHLRRIGIQKIVVHDMCSTDGTREILRGLEGPGLSVVDSTNREPVEVWQGQVVTAVRALHADRVLMIDADEFVLPSAGSLPHALASNDADVISLPRYNVALGVGGPCMPEHLLPEFYGQIRLFTKQDPSFRADLESDPTMYWLRAVPKPKVIVKPEVVQHFRDGMHGVVPIVGHRIKEYKADNIVIAHAALTEFERFARKVNNIREVFQTYDGKLEPDWGWHWRRWLVLADQGALQDEFIRSTLSETSLARLQSDGVVQTVHELFAQQLS